MGATFQFIALRRRVALLGVLAMLSQAVVFAWHHHPLLRASRSALPIASIENAPVPLFPVTADDDCPICFALGHHSATPVDFGAAALLPDRDPLEPATIGPIRTPAASYPLFWSRAPPRA